MIAALGPFRLVRKLGRGGFAPVFLAEEIHEGKRLRDVAIKLFTLPRDLDPAVAAAERDAILEEARALCRVEHANIVRFYSIVRDDEASILGLVMELVAGESLAAAGRLDERAAIEVGIDVAWALAAVHGAGLVHRDVKPGNILRGSSGHKLIDFGIVAGQSSRAAIERAATEPAQGVIAPKLGVAGTPGYIAPECLHGAPASPESDLYALGVTLFRLIAGVIPNTPPQRLDASAALAGLIEQLLSPEPSGRPHHADEVARALERIREDKASAPRNRASNAPRAEVRSTRTCTWRSVEDADAAPPEPRAHPPLIGREAALSAVDRAVSDVREGSLRVVLFSGPLGIGRTRLVEAAVDRASVRPGRVLVARCSPERRSPLRPMLRALEAAPRDTSASLDMVRDAIERALRPGAQPGAPAESEALEGVEDALLWASADEMLVIALDDLQWADAHTLGLLRLLVERADAGSSSKLLLLLASRSEPSPSAPLRALLGALRGRARPAVRHVPLAPLSQDEVAALCSAVAPVSIEVVRAAQRGSGGVPFFVVHALLGWREEGALVLRDGAYHPAEGAASLAHVPGVADLLDARLSSYFEEASARSPLRVAEEALAAIALYGGGLARDVIEQALGSGDGLDHALETLASAGILTVAGDHQEYGFSQEMVRQAALNWRSARPWFPRLHRALLAVIAARDDAASEAEFLATGYEKLGARDLALHWLTRAADEATSAGRFGEAARFGERKIALSRDADERMDAELDLVLALIRGRKLEEAALRLTIAVARAPRSPRAWLRARIYRLQIARGLHEPCEPDHALIDDADALGDAALRCEARMALAGVSPQEAGVTLAGEAVALSEGVDPAIELAARILRVELIYASDRRDLTIAQRNLDRAAALASSPWQEIHVEGDRAVIEAELGRTGAAIERVRRLIDRAQAMSMRGQARLLTQNLAAMLLGQGAAREAAEVAERAASMAAAAGDPALQASALSLAADAHRRAGDGEAALRAIDRADELQRARDDRWRALTLLRRAEILAAEGREEEALADAEDARSIAERHGERDLAIGAELWALTRRVRRRAARPSDLEQKVREAEASGVTFRALTRALLAEASAWLDGPRLFLDQEPTRSEIPLQSERDTIRDETKPPSEITAQEDQTGEVGA